MNLVVAKGVLGSYGIMVDTCLSGRGAVTLCDSVPYDIVFLDHMMPGFDGVETLKRIRELRNGMYQDLPVIALTANTVSGRAGDVPGRGIYGVRPQAHRAYRSGAGAAKGPAQGLYPIWREARRQLSARGRGA